MGEIEALPPVDPAAEAAMQQSLGDLSECVMSLYGIRQLLHSHDVGTSQLLPSIEATAAEARHKCAAVAELFRLLRVHAPTPQLREALVPLAAIAATTTDALAASFIQHKAGRLGARDRLALERDAERHGSTLQALRSLAEVAHAAIDPRFAYMTLSELTRGAWHTRPTFVTREIDLFIARADQIAIEVEPQILWALVVRQIARVVEAGVDRPLAYLTADPECGHVLRIGDDGVSVHDTIERVTLQLPHALDEGDALLDAAAQIAHLEVCPSSNQHVCAIAFAAA